MGDEVREVRGGQTIQGDLRRVRRETGGFLV